MIAPLARSDPALNRLEDRCLLNGRAAAPSPTLKDVVYTSGVSDPQRLDVFIPSGRSPAGGWPVVLAIHGGSWEAFDKTEYEPTVAWTLFATGYAVAAPNYTLSTPNRPSWPADIVELRQVVSWVKANAPALGLDPSKVAAMGESSGAQLALLLGSEAAPTRVDAVVDFFGPTDLAALYRQSPQAAFSVAEYLGAAPASISGRSTAASPLSHISANSAPTLIIHGQNDALLPVAQSYAPASALGAAGVPHQLVTLKGVGHSFGLVAGGHDLRPTALRFLRQALGTAARR